ncbi:MAG: formate dehydrogenase accessory protein FdhE [Candidatus Electronema sp. V4]|uniref:formate dehydrogenase accessory protein FdhE n=1 Tax=Candidatus Electronema sp. V4 TaxID=3454756 RepID=UPI00405539FE
MRPVKLEELLLRHPHLEELARLHECLEEALAEAGPCTCPPADRGGSQSPLLRHQGLDASLLTQAGEVLRQVLEALPAALLPTPFLDQCCQLRERLRQSPEEAALAIETVLTECRGGSRTALTVAQESPLLVFFIWKILTKLLAPWREDLEQRLPELAWDEPICPFCGSGPAMAMLKSTRSGRQRLLVCGCCGMRWPWLRLGCAFCGNEEHSQLAMLELEDEVFRLDLCHQCKGYIKTYIGNDAVEAVHEPPLQLADWTTLHLDALALAQGWQRRADSLYAL